MKLEALIQNMTDQIKEAQLKLGYARRRCAFIIRFLP